VGGRTCALPLEHVHEVMRPCPVEPVEPAAGYLRGLALIRGETVPVVDAAVVLGGRTDETRRFVVLRVGERRVALAVAEVVGARALDGDALEALPPLLANRAELVAHMAVLDGKLVEVLASGRLVELGAGPDDARAAS
jgi:purine-binding chemotaxis protein CheW